VIEKIVPQKKCCEQCLTKVHTLVEHDPRGRFKNLKECEGRCVALEAQIFEKDLRIAELLEKNLKLEEKNSYLEELLEELRRKEQEEQHYFQQPETTLDNQEQQ
jgi:uncharacterized protein YqgV (UPF0045/DUF77 family)